MFKFHRPSLHLTLIMFVGLILCVAVGVIASGKLRVWALDKAQSSTGRKIELADTIDIDWGWPITKMTMTDVKISNFDQGSEPDMFSVDKALITVDVKYLLRHFDLRLPQVTLEKPILLLEKDAKGNANWNFTSNGTSAAAAEAATPDDRSDVPAIGQLLIKEGRIAYKDPVTKSDIKLKADTVAGSADPNENLHLEGDGTYQNQPFKIDVTGGSVFQLKDKTDPYPVDLTFVAGATKAHLVGTMTDPVQMKGMDIRLTLSGRDAAELYNLTGVVLPPTPPYQVSGRLEYEPNVWHFQEFKGRMGDSDLNGSVTWDTRANRPKLTGQFVSQNLDFKDLGGFIGAQAKPKAGDTVSDKQITKLQKQEASPYLIPDAPLDISRLKSMDADVDFTGKRLMSENLPLRDFFLKVTLDNSLLKIDPVKFGTEQGDIEAIMSVNAREEPVKIDGEFNFRKLGLKQMFAALAVKLNQPNYADGYIGGTAKLSGTGKSLRQMLASSNGNVGLGMEGGHLSNLLIELMGLDVAQSLGFFVSGDKPTAIRCVIANFGVKDGMMDVRHFVIDTNDTNVKGVGTINLQNEAMDLTLKAYPKDSTFASLRSPINVKGTMKNPEVNLNVSNIASRGVLATLAAVVAAPLAALAFIEPAMGENSNCTKLVRQTNKDTGETRKSSLIEKNGK